MNPALLDRLATVIVAQETFSADDVTNNGAITAAGNHEANATQNSIGSLFQSAARSGWISFTGRVVRSRAPHRKGGADRVWQRTVDGVEWAEDRLSSRG